jgi:hypothetical protein
MILVSFQLVSEEILIYDITPSRPTYNIYENNFLNGTVGRNISIGIAKG